MALSEEDRANLAAYLDGELDDETAQTLEAKLNLDPEARAEADELKQAWSMLDFLPKVEPSPSFTHRTMERLAIHRKVETAPMPVSQRFSWFVPMTWAAAVLLAVGVGYGGSFWLLPPAPPRSHADPQDEQLVRYLPVIERLRAYEQVEDIDFLRSLDQPELFGDDSGS